MIITSIDQHEEKNDDESKNGNIEVDINWEIDDQDMQASAISATSSIHNKKTDNGPPSH